MKTIKIAISLSFLLLFSTSLFAEIKAVSVKGTVAYRDGRNWVPLKVNQVLKEGSRISTGANSSAEIRLNRLNHTVTVKPLSMIQVFSKESATSTDTHIGLKRGGVNARVPRDSNVKTVFKVSTPVATSSVRGTEENIGYGPGTGMTVEVVSGEIEGKNRLGKSNNISGRQKFTQEKGKGKPGHILGDVKDKSFASVYGQGLTPDELETALFTGTDQTGSPDGDTSVIDNLAGSGGGDATTIIEITWP
jgi:hypothetical protein